MMRRTKRAAFEQKINMILTILLCVLVLPVFITIFLGKIRMEQLLLHSSSNKNAQVEEQLPYVVAKQISMQLPEECIKAQCVVARTNMLAALDGRGAALEQFDRMELQELWGEEYESNLECLKTYVKETEGETLQYQGEYIDAAYHKISAGNTRDAKEYNEKSNVPYFTSVPCHEDTTADGYLNVFFWTKDEFIEWINTLFEETELKTCEEIQVNRRDTAGYVLEVAVGQTLYDGETFRKKLVLPSACFEISEMNEGIRIVTLGQGHGFGLSQSMAAFMAKNGFTYKEILSYFYKGVSIVE